MSNDQGKPGNRSGRSRVQAIQRVLVGRPIRWDDGEPEPQRPGLLRSLFHLFHLLLVGIRRSHLTRMAAALSYRTVFGLMPVIVVVAVALASFTSQERQQDMIKGILTYAGLDKLKIDEPRPVMPEQGVVTPPGPQAGGPPEAIAPDAQTLDRWINKKANDIAGKIKSLKMNLIGFAAILTLIYAAMSMLVEIEQAFNEIYSAPEGRGWLRRIVQYWTLLTLGPVLLVASFTISHYFSGSADSIAKLGGDLLGDEIRTVLRFGGATAVTTMLLMLIYAIVPNTRVQVLPAAMGACVAAVLWEASKSGFTAYVGFATRPDAGANYGSLYGAVAILPLFLIWVYLSWLIVLFGLQLAYSMQTYRQATARGLTLSVLATLGLIEDQHPAGRPRMIDPSAMLVVLAAIGRRFSKGQPSDHNQVGQETGIDEQAVGEMLEKLTASGILLRVAGSDRLATYALAKPPASIDALEVLKLGDELIGRRSGLDKPGPIHRLIGAARADALRGKTLQDVMDEPEVPAPAGSQDPRSSPTAPPQPA